MSWFWTFTQFGAGIGLGFFLAAVGLDCFTDSIRRIVDQILRLRKI